MRSITKEWLKAAYDDLLTIEHIIQTEHLTHIVAFHSQQAIEKTLKSLAEEYEIDIQKIHNPTKLQHLLDNKIHLHHETLLARLDELYIESRYPGDLGLLPHGKPALQDAKEFHELAKKIFEEVCSILNMALGEVQK